MSFVANAAITAGVINTTLAAFVLYTNPRSTLNRVYALWGGSVAVWNFAAFFKSFEHVTESQAMIWVGIIQGAVIFLPLTLAHLCQLILRNRTPRWIYGFYALHAALALGLIFTPYYMQGVQKIVGLGWWSIAGPLFRVYLASYAVLTLPLLVGLPAHAWRAKPVRRAQLMVLWFSIVTLWLSGTNDMLPIIGRKTYPGTSIGFIALGSFGAILYGIAVAYSVLHHQLLDIYYAFSRATSLVLRVGFVVAIAMLLLLVGAAFKPGSFDVYETRTSLAVVALSTLVATFLFPKLLRDPIARIERALTGDRFELPDKVRAFIQQLKWQIDLPSALDDFAKFLAGTFRLRSFSLVLLGETKREFSVVRSLPPDSPRLLPNLRDDGAIFSKPFSGGQRFLILQDKPSDEGDDPQAAIRAELGGLEGSVVFPFRVDDEPLGFLLIGDKQNGKRISSEEARLLVELCENISLVVNQISLKNKIIRAQELELIGRMSQGMAHDLNNLTTPISTLLQFLEAGQLNDMARLELVPLSKRNMQKMRAYIDESLFYTDRLDVRLQPTRLDVLVQTIVADAEATKRKGKAIAYQVDLCGDVQVSIDSVLIQRLLTNLISNAVDASKEGGLIRVAVERLKMEKGREWVRIVVADNGSGIPAEIRKRIFEPYFSTKKTGDGERGFGLGLAICKKIATLHGGSLMLESAPGKGTAFSLDLPCQPKAVETGITLPQLRVA